MKTAIFPSLFLCVWVFAFSSDAQCPDQNVTITYFAHTRTFSFNNTTSDTTSWVIRAGRNLQVNVTGFNPYMWNVEVQIEHENFQQEAPSLPENILKAIAAVKDLPVGAVNEVVNIPSLIDIDAKLRDYASPFYADAKDAIIPRVAEQDIIGMYSKVLRLVSELHAEYPELLYNIDNDYGHEVSGSITENTWNMKLKDLLLDLSKLRIDCLKYLSTQKGEKTAFVEVVTGILKVIDEDKMPKIFASLNEQLNELRSAKKIWDDYATLLTSISQIESNLLSLREANLNAVGLSWLNADNNAKKGLFANQLKILDDLNLRCLKYIHQHKASNVSYLEVVKTIKDNLEKGSFKKIFRDYYQLILDADRALLPFSTFPIEAEGDEMKITIKMTPRDSANHPAFRSFEVSRTIDVCGYWQAGFSTGIFVTGLTDERYVQQLDQATQQYCLLDEGDNAADIGINALTHFAYRTASSFALGLHLGAGLTIKEKPSLQILAGPSVIFGKRNSFVLNAGIAVGNRDELLENLETDKKYAAKIETATKKQTRVGWQVSFTYNISISKKEEKKE